jgi:hypothetical protein
MLVLILISVAVLLLSAPLPQPVANWAAFVIALVALILVCIGHAGYVHVP